jgi:hypothetical protein
MHRLGEETPISQKRVVLILELLVIVLIAASQAYGGKDEALKKRLFERYDQKQMSVVHDKILVALLKEGPGLNGRGRNMLEYSVNYDHFDPNFSDWPKDYRSRNLLGEHTTEEVKAGAELTDALSPGEMAQVRLFYVELLKQDILRIDLYLVPLAGKRNASKQNISDTGAGVAYKVDFGCHFRFLIPPRTTGVSDDDYLGYITEQVGHYFVPTQEYLQANKTAAQAEKAAKNVRIEPGMSEDNVIGILGEPAKRIQFGKKTILKYQDITIELEQGKVTDVKAN